MKNQFPILSMLKILALCYIVTIALLAIASFFFLKMKLPESQFDLVIYVFYFVICFFGGFLAGKQASQRRFVFGFLEGILYFGVLILLSLAINQELILSINHWIIGAGLCAGGGTLGGMLS